MKTLSLVGLLFDFGTGDARARARRIWMSCLAFAVVVGCCAMYDHRFALSAVAFVAAAMACTLYSPASGSFRSLVRDGRLKTTVASVVALGAILALLLPIVGCGAAQKATAVQVVRQIDSRMPTIIAAADTVAATIAALTPADAALIAVGDAGFDVAANALHALTSAYLANPSASALAQIQIAINSLEANINTATLSAFAIKDAVSEHLAVAALKGLLTVVTVVFALVEQTETVAQLRQLADTKQIQLARLRPLMDERILAQAAAESGVTVDQFFAAQAWLGLA